MTDTKIHSPGSGCNPPPRVLALVEEVARRHRNTTPADIFGPRKLKRYVRARHECWRILRTHPGPNGIPSLTRIARWFQRDHTTVVHAMRKLQDA